MGGVHVPLHGESVCVRETRLQRHTASVVPSSPDLRPPLEPQSSPKRLVPPRWPLHLDNIWKSREHLLHQLSLAPADQLVLCRSETHTFIFLISLYTHIKHSSPIITCTGDSPGVFHSGSSNQRSSPFN